MRIISIRTTLLSVLVLLLTLSGCRDDNTLSPTGIQGLPHKFHFSADAQLAQGPERGPARL